MGLEDRPVLEPNAAGIDVGAREMFVARTSRTGRESRAGIPTFTEDLGRLTDWLEQCGVTTVALESTGVYWIPLFEILEQRGIRPCLVNARHMKNVPGLRTDWHECQFQQPRLSSRPFGPRKLMKVAQSVFPIGCAGMEN
jgi:transposase